MSASAVVSVKALSAAFNKVSKIPFSSGVSGSTAKHSCAFSSLISVLFARILTTAILFFFQNIMWDPFRKYLDYFLGDVSPALFLSPLDPMDQSRIYYLVQIPLRDP